MIEKKLLEYADLAYDIIGVALEVHNELGYGISEGIYEEALCLELNAIGLHAQPQLELPVFYKGQLLEKKFRIDIVVNEDVIIELKAMESILPEHRAQLFNYMRLTKKPIGILMNFGKSFRSEKYIYNSTTNDVSFFNVKCKRQL